MDICYICVILAIISQIALYLDVFTAGGWCVSTVH